MKKMLISVGVLLLFLTGSVLWEGHLDERLHAMLFMIEEVEQHLDAGDTQAAHLRLQQAAKEWEHTQENWNMMVNHSTLETAGSYLNRAMLYAEEREKVLARAELTALKLLLRDLENIHDFRVGNLL